MVTISPENQPTNQQSNINYQQRSTRWYQILPENQPVVGGRLAQSGRHQQLVCRLERLISITTFDYDGDYVYQQQYEYHDDVKNEEEGDVDDNEEEEEEDVDYTWCILQRTRHITTRLTQKLEGIRVILLVRKR